jgi:HrpA-like RNA helicase
MDINLLISLISDIHQKTDLTEAILVFLPGYEEIVNVKENLEHNVSNMKICMLHSQLNSRDQKQAFAKFRNDRKVVLATNIAETSLTIDDVTVVIDAGKKTSLDQFGQV